MTSSNKDLNTKFDEQRRFNELVEQYPYLKEARDYGVDIQMLMDNADRTPTERIRRLQYAVNAFNLIKGAKKL